MANNYQLHSQAEDAGLLELIATDEDLRLEFWYMYNKADPGCMYRSNGDPGWPPEPASVSLFNVRMYHKDDPKTKVDLLPVLGQSSIEALQERVLEQHEDGLGIERGVI